MRANQLRQEFFTPETLAEICSRLVTHYFLLTPAELELWDTDPESFGKYLYTYIHIYIYIYVGDERTQEPSLWNFGKTPSIVI